MIAGEEGKPRSILGFEADPAEPQLEEERHAAEQREGKGHRRGKEDLDGDHDRTSSNIVRSGGTSPKMEKADEISQSGLPRRRATAMPAMPPARRFWLTVFFPVNFRPLRLPSSWTALVVAPTFIAMCRALRPHSMPPSIWASRCSLDARDHHDFSFILFMPLTFRPVSSTDHSLHRSARSSR